MPNTTRLQPLKQPAASDTAIEAIARRAYEACHRDDTFDDLKRRAGFSREAAGLLRAWTEAARSGRLSPVGSPSPDQPVADEVGARAA
ncbi:hypothetical protein [Microvirga sp. G4-2]|uniref:hypothetical protein n=1 Tax=Microvirga sp. G4-2 TaxID=3434467 RepID=UPI004044D91B